jgi:hypothetical protein
MGAQLSNAVPGSHAALIASAPMELSIQDFVPTAP